MQCFYTTRHFSHSHTFIQHIILCVRSNLESNILLKDTLTYRLEDSDIETPTFHLHSCPIVTTVVMSMPNIPWTHLCWYKYNTDQSIYEIWTWTQQMFLCQYHSSSKVIPNTKLLPTRQHQLTNCHSYYKVSQSMQKQILWWIIIITPKNKHIFFFFAVVTGWQKLPCRFHVCYRH